jgi:hypothetical protein
MRGSQNSAGFEFALLFGRNDAQVRMGLKNPEAAG